MTDKQIILSLTRELESALGENEQLKKDNKELLRALDVAANEFTIDFVRCGIATNYSGEYREELMEKHRDPMVHSLSIANKHHRKLELQPPVPEVK